MDSKCKSGQGKGHKPNLWGAPEKQELNKDLLNSSNYWVGLRGREMWESEKRHEQSPLLILPRCCVELPTAWAGSLNCVQLLSTSSSTVIATQLLVPLDSPVLLSWPPLPKQSGTCLLFTSGTITTYKPFTVLSMSLSISLNHNCDHTILCF